MGAAIYQLSKLQVGIETAKGDLSAATRVLEAVGTVTEEQDFYRSSSPQGYRGNSGGLGVIVRRGTGLKYATELTPEEILWALRTGVRGAVSPTQASTSGTANVAVTTAAGYLDDSRVTLVVDAWVGATVTCDGKTGVVTSNTTTKYNVASWSGGTPAAGSAYSVAGLGYTHVFSPQLTTGLPTIDTAAIEAVYTDGSTNHYFGKAGYGMTSGFDMQWSASEEARLSVEMFARARQTGSPTGSLAAYSSREVLRSHLLSVYLDTTWAGLGGTQLTGIVRDVKLSTKTGYAPDPGMSGRADGDFLKHKVGVISARLSLLMELDSEGADRFAAYRSNSAQYIRLKNTGTTIAGSGGLVKTVQVDGAYRFVGEPQTQQDGDQMMVACELESFVDRDTSQKTLEYTAINALSAIT